MTRDSKVLFVHLSQLSLLLAQKTKTKQNIQAPILALWETLSQAKPKCSALERNACFLASGILRVAIGDLPEGERCTGFPRKKGTEGALTR